MDKQITASSSVSIWPATDTERQQLQAILSDNPGIQDRITAAFTLLIRQESLPEAQLLPLLETLYLPMAHWVYRQHQQIPYVLGINGAQGSGKSTVSKILQLLLQSVFSRHVIILSIDDFYLTKQLRQRIASEIHPLLTTRGVPGTHDVDMAINIISRLKQGEIEGLLLPQFNKANDNPEPDSQWKSVTCQPDIIIFEGWCVGAKPQAQEALKVPLNSLESLEDENIIWREYVNQRLETDYQTLFSFIDGLLMMKIPDFKYVYEWRSLQEKKLRNTSSESAKHIMSGSELKRFIMHYERITHFNLQEMPDRADVLLCLNSLHQIETVSLLSNSEQNN